MYLPSGLCKVRIRCPQLREKGEGSLGTVRIDKIAREDMVVAYVKPSASVSQTCSVQVEHPQYDDIADWRVSTRTLRRLLECRA